MLCGKNMRTDGRSSAFRQNLNLCDPETLLWCSTTAVRLHTKREKNSDAQRSGRAHTELPRRPHLLP